jgi:hypothetical protein
LGEDAVYFQRVLKGIHGVDDDHAKDMLCARGIACNWWRRVGVISPPEIQDKLTERNLDWHLNRYDQFDPSCGLPFCDDTPFVSTTAGAVERDALLARNIIHPPLLTALRFATDNFTQDGYVFHGYVYTLGKKSLDLEEFAEEVRELHIYTAHLPYQPEGEIVAKIHIPAVRLEKLEKYCAQDVFTQLAGGLAPTPVWTHRNPLFRPPERYSNVRGYV